MTTTGRIKPAADTPREDRRLKEDAQSWCKGYRAGRLGLSLFLCPYPAATIESWSWVGGHIEGNDRREKDEYRA